jgi:hypothetical protein
MIEGFFDNWFATWGSSTEAKIPPYVEILVSHTRLSTYGSVVNHPTAPLYVKKFFHAAGLSAALNVMRAFVQGEGQLISMPNNTAIMISFAACFALRISTMSTGNRLSLAPSIKILIEETADVLKRIGSTPSHRKGLSALYGRHLREIVKNTSEPLSIHDQNGQMHNHTNSIAQNTPIGSGQHVAHSTHSSRNAPILSFEPLLFSTMSDHQIREAINNAGDELETCLPNFQVDDHAGLDWLDWFSMETNQ